MTNEEFLIEKIKGFPCTDYTVRDYCCLSDALERNGYISQSTALLPTMIPPISSVRYEVIKPFTIDVNGAMPNVYVLGDILHVTD